MSKLFATVKADPILYIAQANEPRVYYFCDCDEILFHNIDGITIWTTKGSIYGPIPNDVGCRMVRGKKMTEQEVLTKRSEATEKEG